MPMRAVAACSLLLLGCESSAASCRQALTDYRVSVFRDSSVRGDQLHAGRPAGCEDREVRSIAGVLSRSLSRVPAQDRRALSVHLNVDVTNGPPIRDIEVHADGALLVNQAPADETIWLHEYFHTISGHPAGKTELATRSLRALEEGAADYFAATFAETHEVGSADGREVRDLSDPKRAGERLWLLFARDRADVHTLGLSFARELWAVHGGNSQLALALATCLQRGAAATPISDPSELAKFCPAHTRTTVSKSISRWMLRNSAQNDKPLVLEET